VRLRIGAAALAGTVAFTGAVALLSTDARALGIRSPVPVAVRARIDVHVLASESSGEWTITSRAPSDESRFMADLTAGNAKTGVLYAKGVSSWRDADDALGRVEFRADQGDYLYGLTWSDSAQANVRLFADERRFFTHDMGVATVEDDVADDFEHRLGGRLDAHMETVRASYWIASLDDGDERRTNQYAALRFAPSHVFAGVSYLYDAPAEGEHRAVAKAELAGHYDRVTAVASFEASAQGSGAPFPTTDWDDFDGSDYSATSPANSATFLELRTRRVPVLADHLFDFVYAYQTAGDDYVNDLSRVVPGSVTHRAWLDWAHRRYALDARLSAHATEQSLFEPSKRSGVDVSARARTNDNAEWLARGGVEREETPTRDETTGFAHTAYTRELREFLGGIHLLVDDIGEDTRVAAGAEVRLNWSATGAVSGRWIVSDDTGGSDAVWVRLELRPTRRSWVTLSYGRETRGDDAWFLEDRDALPASDTGNVVTLTVRGDL
jgi:hypothetical protein